MLTKDNVQDIYALTPMQEGMLAQFARSASSSAYIEQFDFFLEGEVELAALQRSLDGLIGKYDALRTIFSFRKTDAPRQIVLKERNASIRVEHYTDLDAAGAAAAVELFKEADRANGFDLCSDLLIRVALLKVAPKRQRMVVTFHHIILDGWCLATVFGDLFGNYERLCLDPTLAIDEHESVPYGAYIGWIARQDKEQAEQYWATYLQGFQAETGPPYSDLKHSGEVDPALHQFSLGVGVSASLAQLAKTRRITVNSLFQTAWGVLLQKYNNTDDVVFGSVVSGRPPDLPGVEQMVGLFINTQPMRIACNPEERFIDVAARVQERAVAAMAYDYHPLFAIQSASALKNKLLNHIVAFENYPISERMQELSSLSRGLRIHDVRVFEQTNYDFNVIVCPGLDIRVKFTYNRSRYGDEVVASLARSLVCLLTHACNEPELQVRQLRMCADVDAERILAEFNDTARAYPSDQSVTALFLENVVRRPEDIAVRCASASFTYRELHALALAAAVVLRARDVDSTSAVALLAPRGPEMVVAILAILYCGAAYVPIDPATPVERVRFMLDDAGAALLCTVDAYRRLVPQGVHAHFIDGVASAATAPALATDAIAPLALGPDHCAYIMYTSGSTGKPKGCCVTHKNIVRLVRNTNYVNFGPDQRFLQIGAPAFDASTFEIWGALLNGGQLCLVDEATIVDASLLRRALHDYQITALFLTGALFNQLCEADAAMFGGLQYLLVGGEVLSPRYIERARAANPGLRVINGYGPTENTTFSTYFEIERSYQDAIPIGKPIANSTAYVLDSASNLLPPGAYGELCVGGDGVAQGYLKREELSGEKFGADPFRRNGRMYRTGDVARWLPDGNISLLGRNDLQVKIRGFRIELGEIERALCAIDAVNDAVVVARDGAGGKQLHAFYVSATELEARSLRAALSQALPSYMVPVFYSRLQRLPLTVNGKVDRRALPVQDSMAQRPATALIEPKSVAERRIAQICQEVLGIEQIGIDDNFFDVGANSLNLITINNRLKEAFARDIPMTVLFEYTSIARLAEYIGADAATAEAKLALEMEQLERAKNTLLKTRNFMRAMEE